MSLTDIRTYLIENGGASLPDMARHLGTDAAVLRGMLDVWVRKGRVRIRPPEGTCDGCTACGIRCAEVYEWTTH